MMEKCGVFKSLCLCRSEFPGRHYLLFPVFLIILLSGCGIDYHSYLKNYCYPNGTFVPVHGKPVSDPEIEWYKCCYLKGKAATAAKMNNMVNADLKSGDRIILIKEPPVESFTAIEKIGTTDKEIRLHYPGRSARWAVAGPGQGQILYFEYGAGSSGWEHSDICQDSPLNEGKEDKYTGEWKDGKYNGQGTKTWENGDKYTGEWKDGRHNGQGTKTWENGDRYTGGWKEGRHNGQGTYIWKNGDKYTGEWKEGKRNGEGVYTCTSGKNYPGTWKEGVYTGGIIICY